MLKVILAFATVATISSAAMATNAVGNAFVCPFRNPKVATDQTQKKVVVLTSSSDQGTTNTTGNGGRQE